MADIIRAIQYGCGPIGVAVGSLAASRGDIELVGALDVDKEKVGRDLGALREDGGELGVIVRDDAEALFAVTDPDVVFHTTGSSFPGIFGQLEGIIGSGVNIVSTCEELSFPWLTEPDLTAKLDSVAREGGVTVLGTGINPGFLMDLWPLAMTAPCQDIKHVRGVRIQDASPRRLPFQVKIGASRTPAEFQQLVDEGTLRHVGLPESVAMIAGALGWNLDDIQESIEPVMAEQPVSSPLMSVEAGQAAGVKQIGRGLIGGREVINLEFQAYIGAPDPYDAVYVTGTPNMEVILKGGMHGDIGTAAVTVNAARRVVEAPPGFVTMKDLPPVVCPAD